MIVYFLFILFLHNTHFAAYVFGTNAIQSYPRLTF